MQIVISFENDAESITIDVSQDFLLDDLMAFIEAETSIPAERQLLIYNGIGLKNGKKTLYETCGKDRCLIQLKETHVVTNPSAPKGQGYTQSVNPDLKLVNARFSSTFANSKWRPNGRNMQSAATIPAKSSNQIVDPNSHARVLRQMQIEENLQLAFDISPESFVPVNLLYMKLRINSHDAFALVDTGAQQTVLHPKLAEKFGILSLIDERFASTTIGVGTQRSEGRIHSVPVSLGDLNVELPCSFTILDIHVGILFGLDMLRRHKCRVDLAEDALVIGDQRVKFLSDYEIEKHVLASQLEYKKPQAPQPTHFSETRSENSDFDVGSIEVESSFAEASISKIMSLGFTKEEAIEALKKAKGNVELAASSLF